MPQWSMFGQFSCIYILFQNALLDLLGGTDNLLTTPTLNSSDKQNSTNDNIPNNQDLLDLLGGIDLSSTTPAPTIAPTSNIIMNNSNGNNILSMLSSPTSPSLQTANILSSNLVDDLTNNTSNALTTNNIKLTALDKNGLNVILVPQKNVGDGLSGSCLRVIMSATNNSLNTLEQYLFQAAVPKSFTLQMLSPSGSVLPPGGSITQEMRLTNTAKVSVLISHVNF